MIAVFFVGAEANPSFIFILGAVLVVGLAFDTD
jgi:hypothetical protein